MSLLTRLFTPNFVWSFAVYATGQPFPPDLTIEQPIKVFSSKRLRFFRRQPHTQADPFLLVDNETLFVFYEQMYPGSIGRIACSKTVDLKSFEDCGVILSEDHHLSWPFVLRADGEIYMVPESRQAGRVKLYRFDNLPNAISEIRTLREGKYVDPVLLRHQDHWYLFATSEKGLELFVSDNLLTGKFEPHPKSPITADLRFSRSGGPLIQNGDILIRVAQDCSRGYGDNINFVEIATLTPDDYEERPFQMSYFKKQNSWNRDGAHHLSLASFRGFSVVAVDGRQRDHWVNRLLRRPAFR